MKSKFTYVGIRVTDLDRSIAFYTEVLGMKLLNRSECLEAKGKNAALQSEGTEFVLELNWYEKDSPFNTEYVVGEGLDHLAFKVEDLDKAIEEAKKAGSKLLLQMKSPGGRWAYIEDPDGLWIEIF